MDELSAGGVVVKGNEIVVIVPAGRAILALPKGHIDPGESPAEAAAREVREETGITGKNLGKLGDVTYDYQRGGKLIAKTVNFFLFSFQSGDTADHDHEVDDARWIPIEEALTSLEFEGEREMVRLATERFEQPGNLSQQG